MEKAMRPKPSTMPAASWSLPAALCDRPHQRTLQETLQRLDERYGDACEAAVVFGSLARGDYGRDSDCDLLTIAQDTMPYHERQLMAACELAGPRVELLIYTPAEVECMWSDRNLLLLEALADGLVLRDRAGQWARLSSRHQAEQAAGRLTRTRGGWKIVPATPRPGEGGAA
jgi:predicted nucleotidyltransferase